VSLIRHFSRALMLYSLSPTVGAAEQRALLIEIGEQPAESTWHGAVLDAAIPMMRDTLRQHGFRAKHIQDLSGPEATRAGMDRALGELNAATEPGDRVVLFYNGHGARGPDDNGDEPDGMDELLVPYGAPWTAPVDFDQYMRDDDLGEWLRRIRTAAGSAGHVTVILDACYSGTGARGGEAQVLGGMLPGTEPNGTGQDRASGWLETPSGARGGSSDEAGLAPLTVLSAARHDQQAQWQRVDEASAGLLTHALSRILAANNSDMSWRGLRDRLEVVMREAGSRQVPQIEGDLNRLVFGGTSGQVPFFRVKTTSDEEVVLAGGAVHGLAAGFRLVFFPSGTASPEDLSAAIASAVVVEVGPFTATTRLEQTDAPDLINAWAFVTDRTTAIAPLRLALVELPAEIDASVRGQLGRTALVEMVEAEPEWLATASGNRRNPRMQIKANADELVLMDVPMVDADPRLIADVIRNLARSRYLRTLQLDHPSPRIDLDIAPADVAYADDGSCQSFQLRTDLEAFLREGGGWQLGVGDGFALDLAHLGSIPAWLAVVGFNPDGTAVLLYPRPGVHGESIRLPAGDRWTVGKELCLSFDEPGTYMLKVFATTEHVDFTWLDTDIFSARGGTPSALDLLFQDIEAGGRGSVYTGIGHTDEVIIEVVADP